MAASLCLQCMSQRVPVITYCYRSRDLCTYNRLIALRMLDACAFYLHLGPLVHTMSATGLFLHVLVQVIMLSLLHSRI